ncbi:MAG: globin-coupled sensor protein, partial [Alphaproteobacteria bacterium]|nr:globin-coupled sensor protein [Alphaproteobacteria bacterium]
MSRHHADEVVETLSERLGFLQVDERVRQDLRLVRPMIERHLARSLDRFYDVVRRTPQVARLFGGEAMIARAKASQLDHWMNISSGAFDQVYVNKVTTIGSTHARIGLEPRWYIGGYALILEDLIKAIMRETWPRWGLGFGRKRRSDAASRMLAALVKSALLDMDIAISVYLATAEEEKKRAEAAAIANERELVARSIGNGLLRLASKDLSYRITDDMPEAYRKLQADFNAALEQLEDTIVTVSGGMHTINSGTQEISTASDDLSRRTESQAANLEETAAAVAEITATVKKTATGAVHARDVVASAKDDAARSGDVVKKAIEAMNGIERSSQQITQIIGVIDEIAFQTNLLAL